MRLELAGRSLPWGRYFIPRADYTPATSFLSAVLFRKASYENHWLFSHVGLRISSLSPGPDEFAARFR